MAVTFQASKAPFVRICMFDGVSTSFTADYSNDIEEATLQRIPTPVSILYADTGSISDKNGPIPFSTVLHGKKVTWTFERPPIANGFAVTVGFLFPSD